MDACCSAVVNGWVTPLYAEDWPERWRGGRMPRYFSEGYTLSWLKTWRPNKMPETVKVNPRKVMEKLAAKLDNSDEELVFAQNMASAILPDSKNHCAITLSSFKSLIGCILLESTKEG